MEKGSPEISIEYHRMLENPAAYFLQPKEVEQLKNEALNSEELRAIIAGLRKELTQINWNTEGDKAIVIKKRITAYDFALFQLIHKG